MTSKIESEILDATGVNPKRGEARKDFLDRLANHLDDNKKFTDDDYNKLSDPAQKWANSACTALGKKDEIPDFPDAEKAKDKEADKDDKASGKNAKADKGSEGAEEEEVTSKKKATASGGDKKAAEPKGDAKKTGVAKTGDLKKAAPKDDKKAAPKASAEKKAAKEAKPTKAAKEPKEKKAGGKSADLKKMILAKPERTNADLMELMKKKGHDITLSTLSTIRSGFLHSMQVIIDEGRLKPAKD